MPSFLVQGIYLLLLPDDGEGTGWIHFLHGDSVEDEGDNYDVSILTGMTTHPHRYDDTETFICRRRHQGGDGVVAME